MEAPVFEFPLQDSVVSSGADVLLKCIIAGTPIPEGNIMHFFLLKQTTVHQHSSEITCPLTYSPFQLPGQKTT